MAVFGAPKELIEEAKEKSSEDYEVDEENMEIVKAFLQLSTQWRLTQGVYVGLNYQSLELYFKIYKPKDRKMIFEGIQIMEFAALDCLNNKDK